MNRHTRNRLRLRLGIGAVVVVSASTAALSGPAAPPPAARLTSSSSSATGHSPATSGADQAGTAAGGTCPPDATYPDSPTDDTQYEVPFTADILDGTVNVGYNEDSGAPGTKAHTNMPWFPWELHVTGLRGTVSGCVPLPGLSLAVQPSELHVNTYGYAQGPAEIDPHSSATFSYTGIADPGQTSLPLFLTGNTPGQEEDVAGVTTLHYRTNPAPASGLEVSNPTFTEEYSYPGTGPVKKIDLPAGSRPGAALSTYIYAGTVTVTNTTASTVTSINGEESAGFVSGPSSLAPYGHTGDTGTYTFTFEGSTYGLLPDEQALLLTFTGEGSTGLVDGSGIAYFTFPSLGVSPLQITAATINGHSATTAPGPEVASGSVFNGTFTVTNDTSSKVTGAFGETGQAVQLLATAATSGTPSPPIVLSEFSLKVSATKALSATVVGARPDGLGATPYGALDASAKASAEGVLSATEPPLVCGAPVTATVTTGTSTNVPTSPTGDPPHPAGSQWTVQGEPISGALSGATARLVSNTFSLKIPYTQACGIYGEFFNWEIGGVEPNGKYYNCPTCSTFGKGGAVDAGAGPGEAQVEIDVMLVRVGGLAVCRPSETTSVACNS